MKLWPTGLITTFQRLTGPSVTYGGPWKLSGELLPENAIVTIQVKIASKGVGIHELETGVVITSGGRAPYIGVDLDYGSSGSPVSYNGTPVGLYGNGAYEGGSFVSWLSVGSHIENLQKTDGVELENTGNIVVSGEGVYVEVQR